MAKGLYGVVKAGLYVEPDSEAFVYTYAESILYLVGSSSAFEYQEYIKPYCSEYSAKLFRLSIQDQRYANLDLKLFSLRLARMKSPTKEDAFSLGALLGITRNDTFMVYTLFSENGWFRRALCQAGRKVGRNNVLLDPKEIDTLFTRIYPSILKYIKFISYKKLRFIVKSDNITFEDMHSDLSTKVLQSFYSLIPAQATELHIINYLKRAVHNHAINIIKSHTSQKRGRLVNVGSDKNNENQFSLLCVSQNQVHTGVDEDGNPVDILNVANDAHTKFELEFSVSEVLNSVKHRKKKYRFISLLMGKEDAEFTDWLKQEELCKPSEDNVDVQARCSANEFNGYVAEFLKVTPGKVETFLGSLRELMEA
jgi:hypothetical protein